MSKEATFGSPAICREIAKAFFEIHDGCVDCCDYEFCNRNMTPKCDESTNTKQPDYKRYPKNHPSLPKPKGFDGRNIDRGEGIHRHTQPPRIIIIDFLSSNIFKSVYIFHELVAAFKVIK